MGGCDVSLENIQVNQIRAGSHLNDEQVQILGSPNLRPRACGVDIRPNTMVTINQNVGLLIGDDIVGFDTCYDQQEEQEEGVIDDKSLWFMVNNMNQSSYIVDFIDIRFVVYLQN